MEIGDTVVCKKDSYTSTKSGKIIHKKGVKYIIENMYNITAINEKTYKVEKLSRIFIYPEENSNADSYGYHLNGYNSWRWKKFSTYFMSEKELRKEKIKKINEVKI